MSMITTSNIPSLLRDGLKSVFGDYKHYKPEWEAIFSKHTSHRNYEIEVEMQLLGAASQKPEGQGGTYGNMQEFIRSNYQMYTYSSGFLISNEALSDNLYKDAFPRGNLALKDSMAETKNIVGANILNNGFNSSYTGGDGQPLFSTAHPTSQGTYSNTFSTGASLSQTSLQNAITQIKQFKNAAGLRINTKAMRLIVPVELEWTAAKILHSKFAPDTANNAINTVNGILPKGYASSVFLTNPAAWFLITDCSNGLKMFQRQNLSIDSFTDIDADALKVRATERYAFGWSDARGAFGSQGV
jgi:hypothetical protein